MNKQAEHFLNTKLVPIITVAIIFLFWLYINVGQKEHDQAVMDACIELNTDNISDKDKLIEDCIELLETT
jgi:hypothetical protein